MEEASRDLDESPWKQKYANVKRNSLRELVQHGETAVKSVEPKLGDNADRKDLSTPRKKESLSPLKEFRHGATPSSTAGKGGTVIGSKSTSGGGAGSIVLPPAMGATPPPVQQGGHQPDGLSGGPSGGLTPQSSSANPSNLYAATINPYATPRIGSRKPINTLGSNLYDKPFVLELDADTIRKSKLDAIEKIFGTPRDKAPTKKQNLDDSTSKSISSQQTIEQSTRGTPGRGNGLGGRLGGKVTSPTKSLNTNPGLSHNTTSSGLKVTLGQVPSVASIPSVPSVGQLANPTFTAGEERNAVYAVLGESSKKPGLRVPSIIIPPAPGSLNPVSTQQPGVGKNTTSSVSNNPYEIGISSPEMNRSPKRDSPDILRKLEVDRDTITNLRIEKVENDNRILLPKIVGVAGQQQSNNSTGGNQSFEPLSSAINSTSRNQPSSAINNSSSRNQTTSSARGERGDKYSSHEDRDRGKGSDRERDLLVDPSRVEGREKGKGKGVKVRMPPLQQQHRMQGFTQIGFERLFGKEDGRDPFAGGSRDTGGASGGRDLTGSSREIHRLGSKSLGGRGGHPRTSNQNVASHLNQLKEGQQPLTDAALKALIEGDAERHALSGIGDRHSDHRHLSASGDSNLTNSKRSRDEMYGRDSHTKDGELMKDLHSMVHGTSRSNSKTKGTGSQKMDKICKDFNNSKGEGYTDYNNRGEGFKHAPFATTTTSGTTPRDAADNGGGIIGLDNYIKDPPPFEVIKETQSPDVCPEVLDIAGELTENDTLKAVFGQDLLFKRGPGFGLCQICYDETDHVMKRPCNNNQKNDFNSTEILGEKLLPGLCNGMYCKECLLAHAENMVSSALYACPILKCPDCRYRIPSIVWVPLLSEEQFSKYYQSAEALLTYRCPDCDSVGSLLNDHPGHSLSTHPFLINREEDEPEYYAGAGKGNEGDTINSSVQNNHEEHGGGNNSERSGHSNANNTDGSYIAPPSEDTYECLRNAHRKRIISRSCWDVKNTMIARGENTNGIDQADTAGGGTASGAEEKIADVTNTSGTSATKTPSLFATVAQQNDLQIQSEIDPNRDTNHGGTLGDSELTLLSENIRNLGGDDGDDWWSVTRNGGSKKADPVDSDTLVVIEDEETHGWRKYIFPNPERPQDVEPENLVYTIMDTLSRLQRKIHGVDSATSTLPSCSIGSEAIIQTITQIEKDSDASSGSVSIFTRLQHQIDNLWNFYLGNGVRFMELLQDRVKTFILNLNAGHSVSSHSGYSPATQLHDSANSSAVSSLTGSPQVVIPRVDPKGASSKNSNNNSESGFVTDPSKVAVVVGLNGTSDSSDAARREKELLSILNHTNRFQIYNFLNDPEVSLDDLSTPGHSKLLAPPPLLQERFFSLIRHIEDVERKSTLLLAWFRQYPYFSTPCCESKLCFKCKTSEWHHGVSCESRMRAGFGAPRGGVQWCPKCGVPTVKSEGCNHIVCVCGSSWEWMGSSLFYASVHSMPDRLQEALEQLPKVVKIRFEKKDDVADLCYCFSQTLMRLNNVFNLSRRRHIRDADKWRAQKKLVAVEKPSSSVGDIMVDGGREEVDVESDAESDGGGLFRTTAVVVDSASEERENLKTESNSKTSNSADSFSEDDHDSSTDNDVKDSSKQNSIQRVDRDEGDETCVERMDATEKADAENSVEKKEEQSIESVGEKNEVGRRIYKKVWRRKYRNKDFHGPGSRIDELPVKTELMRVLYNNDQVIDTDEEEKLMPSKTAISVPIRKIEELQNVSVPCEIWFRLPDPNRTDEDDEDDENEDSSRYRALHIAAIACSQECVEVLLKHGEDVNIISERDGLSPLAALLVERATRFGALHDATPKQQLSMVKLLLERKADPNLRTIEDEQTPLSLALAHSFANGVNSGGIGIENNKQFGTGRFHEDTHEDTPLTNTQNTLVIGQLNEKLVGDPIGGSSNSGSSTATAIIGVDFADHQQTMLGFAESCYNGGQQQKDSHLRDQAIAFQHSIQQIEKEGFKNQEENQENIQNTEAYHQDNTEAYEESKANVKAAGEIIDILLSLTDLSSYTGNRISSWAESSIDSWNWERQYLEIFGATDSWSKKKEVRPIKNNVLVKKENDTVQHGVLLATTMMKEKDDGSCDNIIVKNRSVVNRFEYVVDNTGEEEIAVSSVPLSSESDIVMIEDENGILNKVDRKKNLNQVSIPIPVDLPPTTSYLEMDSRMDSVSRLAVLNAAIKEVYSDTDPLLAPKIFSFSEMQSHVHNVSKRIFLKNDQIYRDFFSKVGLPQLRQSHHPLFSVVDAVFEFFDEESEESEIQHKTRLLQFENYCIANCNRLLEKLELVINGGDIAITTNSGVNSRINDVVNGVVTTSDVVTTSTTSDTVVSNYTGSNVAAVIVGNTATDVVPKITTKISDLTSSSPIIDPVSLARDDNLVILEYIRGHMRIAAQEGLVSELGSSGTSEDDTGVDTGAVDDTTGVVVDMSKRDLKDTMSALVTDPKSSNIIGNNILNYVTEDFDHDHLTRIAKTLSKERNVNPQLKDGIVDQTAIDGLITLKPDYISLYSEILANNNGEEDNVVGEKGNDVVLANNNGEQCNGKNAGNGNSTHTTDGRFSVVENGMVSNESAKSKIPTVIQVGKLEPNASSARTLKEKRKKSISELISDIDRIRCLRWRFAIDPLNSIGETPLFVACRRGLSRVVLLLCKRNANPNAVDDELSTPLIASLKCYIPHIDLRDISLKREELVRILLSYRADPNLHRPINVAVVTSNITTTCVELLLQAKADLNFDINEELSKRKRWIAVSSSAVWDDEGELNDQGGLVEQQQLEPNEDPVEVGKNLESTGTKDIVLDKADYTWLNEWDGDDSNLDDTKENLIDSKLNSHGNSVINSGTTSRVGSKPGSKANSKERSNVVISKERQTDDNTGSAKQDKTVDDLEKEKTESLLLDIAVPPPIPIGKKDMQETQAVIIPVPTASKDPQSKSQENSQSKSSGPDWSEECLENGEDWDENWDAWPEDKESDEWENDDWNPDDEENYDDSGNYDDDDVNYEEESSATLAGTSKNLAEDLLSSTLLMPPFLASVTEGHSDISQLLLKHRADITATTLKGENVFHLWSKYGDEGSVPWREKEIRYLEQSTKLSEMLNALNSDNDTPLLCAIKESHENGVLAVLLGLKADPNFVPYLEIQEPGVSKAGVVNNNFQNTALSLANAFENTNVLIELIVNRSDRSKDRENLERIKKLKTPRDSPRLVGEISIQGDGRVPNKGSPVAIKEDDAMVVRGITMSTDQREPISCESCSESTCLKNKRREPIDFTLSNPLYCHMSRRRTESVGSCILLLDFKADIYQETIDCCLSKIDRFLVRHLPYLLEQLYYERNFNGNANRPHSPKDLLGLAEDVILVDGGIVVPFVRRQPRMGRFGVVSRSVEQTVQGQAAIMAAETPSHTVSHTGESPSHSHYASAPISATSSIIVRDDLHLLPQEGSGTAIEPAYPIAALPQMSPKLDGKTEASLTGMGKLVSSPSSKDLKRNVDQILNGNPIYENPINENPELDVSVDTLVGGTSSLIEKEDSNDKSADPCDVGGTTDGTTAFTGVVENESVAANPVTTTPTAMNIVLKNSERRDNSGIGKNSTVVEGGSEKNPIVVRKNSSSSRKNSSSSSSNESIRPYLNSVIFGILLKLSHMQDTSMSTPNSFLELKFEAISFVARYIPSLQNIPGDILTTDYFFDQKSEDCYTEKIVYAPGAANAVVPVVATNATDATVAANVVVPVLATNGRTGLLTTDGTGIAATCVSSAEVLSSGEVVCTDGELIPKTTSNRNTEIISLEETPFRIDCNTIVATKSPTDVDTKSKTYFDTNSCVTKPLVSQYVDTSSLIMECLKIAKSFHYVAEPRIDDEINTLKSLILLLLDKGCILSKEILEYCIQYQLVDLCRSFTTYIGQIISYDTKDHFNKDEFLSQNMILNLCQTPDLLLLSNLINDKDEIQQRIMERKKEKREDNRKNEPPGPQFSPILKKTWTDSRCNRFLTNLITSNTSVTTSQALGGIDSLIIHPNANTALDANTSLDANTAPDDTNTVQDTNTALDTNTVVIANLESLTSPLNASEYVFNYLKRLDITWIVLDFQNVASKNDDTCFRSLREDDPPTSMTNNKIYREKFGSLLESKSKSTTNLHSKSTTNLHSKSTTNLHSKSTISLVEKAANVYTNEENQKKSVCPNPKAPLPFDQYTPRSTTTNNNSPRSDSGYNNPVGKDSLKNTSPQSDGVTPRIVTSRSVTSRSDVDVGYNEIIVDKEKTDLIPDLSSFSWLSENLPGEYVCSAQSHTPKSSLSNWYFVTIQKDSQSNVQQTFRWRNKARKEWLLHYQIKSPFIFRVSCPDIPSFRECAVVVRKVQISKTDFKYKVLRLIGPYGEYYDRVLNKQDFEARFGTMNIFNSWIGKTNNSNVDETNNTNVDETNNSNVDETNTSNVDEKRITMLNYYERREEISWKEDVLPSWYVTTTPASTNYRYHLHAAFFAAHSGKIQLASKILLDKSNSFVMNNDTRNDLQKQILNFRVELDKILTIEEMMKKTVEKYRRGEDLLFDSQNTYQNTYQNSYQKQVREIQDFLKKLKTHQVSEFRGSDIDTPPTLDIVLPLFILCLFIRWPTADGNSGGIDRCGGGINGTLNVGDGVVHNNSLKFSYPYFGPVDLKEFLRKMFKRVKDEVEKYSFNLSPLAQKYLNTLLISKSRLGDVRNAVKYLAVSGINVNIQADEKGINENISSVMTSLLAFIEKNFYGESSNHQDSKSSSSGKSSSKSSNKKKKGQKSSEKIKIDSEIQSSQVGSPQIGLPQIGSPQIGSPQIGSPQIGSPQIGSPQIQSPEIGDGSSSMMRGRSMMRGDCAKRGEDIVVDRSNPDSTKHSPEVIGPILESPILDVEQVIGPMLEVDGQLMSPVSVMSKRVMPQESSSPSSQTDTSKVGLTHNMKINSSSTKGVAALSISSSSCCALNYNGKDNGKDDNRLLNSALSNGKKVDSTNSKSKSTSSEKILPYLSHNTPLHLEVLNSFSQIFERIFREEAWRLVVPVISSGREFVNLIQSNLQLDSLSYNPFLYQQIEETIFCIVKPRLEISMVLKIVNLTVKEIQREIKKENQREIKKEEEGKKLEKAEEGKKLVIKHTLNNDDVKTDDVNTKQAEDTTIIQAEDTNITQPEDTTIIQAEDTTIVQAENTTTKQAEDTTTKQAEDNDALITTSKTETCTTEASTKKIETYKIPFDKIDFTKIDTDSWHRVFCVASTFEKSIYRRDKERDFPEHSNWTKIRSVLQKSSVAQAARVHPSTSVGASVAAILLRNLLISLEYHNLQNIQRIEYHAYLSELRALKIGIKKYFDLWISQS